VLVSSNLSCLLYSEGEGGLQDACFLIAEGSPYNFRLQVGLMFRLATAIMCLAQSVMWRRTALALASVPRGS
jgi:hypothetical protein